MAVRGRAHRHRNAYGFLLGLGLKKSLKVGEQSAQAGRNLIEHIALLVRHGYLPSRCASLRPKRKTPATDMSEDRGSLNCAHS